MIDNPGASTGGTHTLLRYILDGLFLNGIPGLDDGVCEGILWLGTVTLSDGMADIVDRNLSCNFPRLMPTHTICNDGKHRGGVAFII